MDYSLLSSSRYGTFISSLLRRILTIADFTPVCTTELGAFAKLKSEFDARGVQMIGLSANDLTSHDKWIDDINETQNTTVNFPIIADADRRVAFLYDMISQDDLDALQKTGGIAFTIRSVFIIDPAKKIRLTMLYPASTGRNTSEVLRVIDSLQTGDKKGIATPINWTAGEDVVSSGKPQFTILYKLMTCRSFPQVSAPKTRGRSLEKCGR